MECGAGIFVSMPKLIILTGAGLSAESGIATFRASDGLWESHRVEEVCHIDTWQRNFDKVHAFYNARRTQLATVEPNAAHCAIAAWQKRYETVVLTQNVDDLLERAGCDGVVHLHGFLPELRCTECECVWNIGYTALATGSRCPECASIRGVKPNIVFFGEMAPQYSVLWNAFNSTSAADSFVVIGTSGVVLPVNSMAVAHEGLKILNNLEREPAIEEKLFGHWFYKPATQAVEEIDRLLRKHFG